MSKSKIEWTDYTWNVITGCTKVSAGCKNCYAESIANRFWGERKFTDVICHEDRLEQPLRLRKPRMIFVNSMSDLFHPDVSFEFIDKVFYTMFKAKHHIFQVLTKRPDRMLEYTDSYRMSKGFDGRTYPLPNVWLGVSVEDQKTADERIPLLLQTPAVIKWISAEPLLDKINLKTGWLNAFIAATRGIYATNDTLDWVVVGCESGIKRRECKIEWIERIVNQCKNSNVPVFVKQIQIDGKVIKDAEQFPKHLRIREYPD